MKIALLFCLSLALALVYGKPSARIVGGEISTKGKWPWMSTIYARYPESGFNNFVFSCVGSLISAEWVLTNAMCNMYGSDPADFRVATGIFNLTADDYEQYINVTEVIRHPDFNPFDYEYAMDLMLLKLATPADLSNPYIGTIKLPEQGADLTANPSCVINGWGWTHPDGLRNRTDMPLREAETPVISNEMCQAYYNGTEYLEPITEVNVCAGAPYLGISICNGDTGGPLQCDMGNGDWRIEGVSSRHSRYCTELPGVFMRVTMFLDWIREHVPDI